MPDKKPQFKRREAWVELTGEYEGFSFRVWVNPPARIWNQVFGNQSAADVKEGLKQVILEHNGWEDFDGNALPAPTTNEFWDEIPTELAGLIIREAQAESNRLPFLAPTRRRN